MAIWRHWWFSVPAVERARRRAVLHLWLAVVLLAWTADVAASLAAFGRYTVGWYFGRIDSMFATSALLVVFVTEINRLYRQLSTAMGELFAANNRLSKLVAEKDGLLGALQQREEQIRRMAYRDPVTDLPNRQSLLEVLAHTLSQGARHHHETALLFLDLDGFKQVNDTLGHDAGDAVLRSTGRVLVDCVRGGDIVSRLGGDEFVILLPEVKALGDATAVAEKTLAHMAAPMSVMGHRVQITAGIGISVAAGEHPDGERLLRRADEAMYAAKRAGRNRYVVGAHD